MRENKFLQRIRVAYNFVRYGKGKCRIMTCEKCGSVFIRPISEQAEEGQLIDDKRQIDVYWSEVDQCMKCGAVCQEIQLWNFEGDAKKIDDGFVVKEK